MCPGLRKALFKQVRRGYVELKVAKAELKATIYAHPEFAKLVAEMEMIFADWRASATKRLKGPKPGFKPKALIGELSESLLAHYEGKPLIKHYDVYQHLMDYWAEVMQDDCYLIAADGSWASRVE